MRVIAGEARGRPLQAPRGLSVRPTAGRMRESLFAMLDSRGAVAGARVLDLFAGTGALGIEAVSRGAAALVAVERSTAVARVLRANVERCGFAGRVEVVVEPVERALGRLAGGAPFDLVLLDPPWRTGAADEALRGLVGSGLLADRALVVVETAHGEAVRAPAGLGVEISRRMGDGQLTVFRRSAGEAAAGEGDEHGRH